MKPSSSEILSSAVIPLSSFPHYVVIPLSSLPLPSSLCPLFLILSSLCPLFLASHPSPPPLLSLSPPPPPPSFSLSLSLSLSLSVSHHSVLPSLSPLSLSPL